MTSIELTTNHREGDIRSDGYRFGGHEYSRGYPRPKWYSPKSWHRRRITTACSGARKRAKEKGLPFNIDIDYLISIFPQDGKCPVLNIDLEWGGARKNSPSLDRIIPEMGYVRGNVQFISDRANLLKNDATIEELLAVADHMKAITANHYHD